MPNFTATSSALLRVPRKQIIDTSTCASTCADDSSVLVSQWDDRNRSRNPRKGRPKCDYCGKLGHKIDKCCALHGRPPRSAAVVHSDPPPRSATVDLASSDTAGHPAIFNDFLKWYEECQSSSSTTSASVAHTGTSFVGLTLLA